MASLNVGINDKCKGALGYEYLITQFCERKSLACDNKAKNFKNISHLLGQIFHGSVMVPSYNSPEE